MPLILTRRGGSGARVTATARTTAARPAVLTALAVTRPTTRGATLVAQVVTRPESRGATLTGVMSGGQPVQVIPGGLPLVTAQEVTGLPGTLMTWSYAAGPDGETLDVTVAGLHGAALPSVELAASATLGGTLVDALPRRSFRQFGQEPQVDVGGNRTTFRFARNFEQDLRGVILPERIPWVLNPSPPACPPRRQRLNVSSFVQGLAREFITPAFHLQVDPLAGAEWVEGTVEYSTRGKTFAQVWADTYGALGMILAVTRFGAGQGLVGRFAEPIRPPASGRDVVGRWVRAVTEGQERLQTPARLTVLGAPDVTDVDAWTLLGWAQGDPAYPELERELLPEGEWIDPQVREGTAVTAHGWRRSAGQVVAEVTTVVDDVTVSETVDGERREQEFRGVATSYSHTSTTFDPECPTRPLSQRTQTRSWGYGLGTDLGSFGTTGPGLYQNLTTGDLLGAENTFTTFTYSPQGFLARELRVSDQVGTAQQQGADLDPQERGPMTARDWIRTVEDVRYSPGGAGRWRRSVTVTRQSLVPLMDAETGDPVRLVTLARTLPQPPQVTDQPPPSFTCDPCGGAYFKTLLDPTGAVVVAGDAGFAEAREVTVPTLPASDLSAAARLVLASQWHRVTQQVQVDYPVSLQPGDETIRGMVREVRMQGEPGRVSSTVTFAALDTLFGSPLGMPVQPYRLDDQQGSSLVIAGRPGGARVRLVTGWDPGSGEATVEDAFVALRDASVRPGEELDWRVVRGRREGTGAR